MKRKNHTDQYWSTFVDDEAYYQSKTIETNVLYQSANEYLLYTCDERFKHLNVLLIFSAAFSVLMFNQNINIYQSFIISALSFISSMYIWIMQWRAIWRMHKLMKYIQHLEGGGGLWSFSISSKRPIWLKRMGDSESTMLYIMLFCIGWLTFALNTGTLLISRFLTKAFKISCFSSIGEFIVFVCSVFMAIIICLWIKSTLKLPKRENRVLKSKAKNVG